jgi:hypothetical protein
VVNATNYTDNFQSKNSSNKWTEKSRTVSGQSYAAMVYTGPGNFNYTTVTYPNAPMLEYSVNIEQAGSYYVWVLGYIPSASNDDTIHFGVDGVRVTLMEERASGDNVLRWFNTNSSGGPVSVPLSQGVHTLNIWGAEDDFELIQLLLTTRPPGTEPGQFTPSLSPQATYPQSTCLVPIPPEFPPNLEQCTNVLQNTSFENSSPSGADFMWTIGQSEGQQAIHGASAYPGDDGSFGINMPMKAPGLI